MYDKPHDFAALISSRICHDMASPLGAICNGIELLELSGVTPSRELALINESIESAMARVQFFRIAFGQASAGTSMSKTALQDIVKTYFSSKKITTSWNIGNEVDRQTARLVCLLIMCAESALPFGGAVEINNSAAEWALSCEGRVRYVSAHWDRLNGDSEEGLSPSLIHFDLACDQATGSGRKILLSRNDTDLMIRFN